MKKKTKEHQTVYKKGVHFNILNEEDKIILEFLENNDVNFSALTKELLLQHINETILDSDAVKKIAREITDEVLESKITSLAFQNEVRKTIIEILQNGNMINYVAMKPKNDTENQEAIIDQAINNYTAEDINAMDF